GRNFVGFDRCYTDFCYASFNEHNVIYRITERNDIMRKNFKFIFVLSIIILIAYMYIAVDSAQRKSDEESYKILSDAIIRSAVQCYAIEGFYPPDIEYLENNYGLLVDHNKYFVSYSVFASNIIPEVQVFLKNPNQ
ncbi:MAG TPA: hypothetical protein PLB33_08680, partial [Sedimentibacter sp.]|nr:hypothetical protein [Sedimentibacter sp.]